MDEPTLDFVAKSGEKIEKERCTAICLCPDWEKGWVRKLFRLVTKKFRFEEGTELFEVNGKSMEGIRSGVWALLVEKGGPTEIPPELRNVVTLNARMLKENYPTKGVRKVGKERQLLLKTDVAMGTYKKWIFWWTGARRQTSYEKGW